MLLGFEFPKTAAKSKKPGDDDAPTHAPMKAGHKPIDRRAPSTDEKKVRRQQAKTASMVENTWADGYGNWHARVVAPDEPEARQLALNAIIDELTPREGPNFAPWVVGVELVSENDNTFEYVETNAHEAARTAVPEGRYKKTCQMCGVAIDAMTGRPKHGTHKHDCALYKRSKTASFYIYDSDDVEQAGPFDDEESARHAYQTALNSGDFTEDDGYYVAAGSGEEGQLRESSMKTEAELLQAIASAPNLETQMALMSELDAVRQAALDRQAADRELDLTASIFEHDLSPVMVHSMHTTATDWIDEVAGDEQPVFDDNDILTEASLWFSRTSPEVRADRDEFAEQAMGYARRVCSSLGMNAPAATRTFLDHVAHLHKISENQSGNAGSSLPAQVPLEGHGDVLDNFAPPVAPENAGVSAEDTSSQRAPVVQENSQDAPETGEQNANDGTTADPSGTATSGLPNVNSMLRHEAHASDEFLFFEAGTTYCKVCGKQATRGRWSGSYCEAHDPGDDNPNKKKTAGTPTGDNADAVSSLPDEPEGADTKRTMWPWEEEMEAPSPSGAADVAGVHTPGQSEADYPQPRKSSVVADRDRATNPQHGDQTACKTCGSDIEYHEGHGWIDRGGNSHCDESGQHPYDKDSGSYGNYEHQKHEPVSDRVASLQVEARECAHCRDGNHSGTNGTPGCSSKSCTCSCGYKGNPPGDASTGYASERKDWTDTRRKRGTLEAEAGGGLDNLGDKKAPPFGKDDDEDDEKKQAAFRATVQANLAKAR